MFALLICIKLLNYTPLTTEQYLQQARVLVSAIFKQAVFTANIHYLDS